MVQATHLHTDASPRQPSPRQKVESLTVVGGMGHTVH